jgi:putative transposase
MMVLVKTRTDPQSALIPAEHVEAAFRYRIVAPFMDPSLSPAEVKAYRRQVLRHKQEHPTRGLIRITARTLRRWKQQYRDALPNGKVAALCPLPRSGGKGTLIPQKALDLAQQLLETNARRSTEFLISEIVHEYPELAGTVKKSTLNRHLRLRNVNRRVLDDDGEPAQVSFKPFEAKKPNDIWQSDVHHGPHALVDGHPVPTRIIAWIDDYSRVCCHCQAYPDETLPMLEDCLKQAIQKYGVPTCAYTDNGSIYSGVQFSLICADLEITPFTSRPYSPWTHGKIERLWGVQEDQLWSEVALVDPMPIDALNKYLQYWVEVRHHRHLHAQTGQAPMERWNEGVKAHRLILRQAAEEQLKRIFWIWARRIVTSTSLIKLHKNQYAVDPDMAGMTVLVRYDPFNLQAIQVWSNARRPELRGEFTAQRPLVSHQAPQTAMTLRDERKPCKAAQRALDELKLAYERLQQQQLGLIRFPINSPKEVP